MLITSLYPSAFFEETSVITDRWHYKAIFYTFQTGNITVVQKLAAVTAKEQFSC
jgi:hypothetical protein